MLHYLDDLDSRWSRCAHLEREGDVGEWTGYNPSLARPAEQEEVSGEKAEEPAAEPAA
jgi:hypothetical protein